MQANSTLKAKMALSSKYFILGALLVLVLDQITKILIIKLLPYGDARSFVDVIDGIFRIVHVTNEGAAWGMMSGQTYFLSSIAIITLVALYLYRHQIGFRFKLVQVAMGLFAGGVLGNLLDRIMYGHVVDFLDVYLPFADYHWPAFNVADMAIFFGVFSYLIMSFILPIDEKQEKKEDESTKL